MTESVELGLFSRCSVRLAAAGERQVPVNSICITMRLVNVKSIGKGSSIKITGIRVKRDKYYATEFNSKFLTGIGSWESNRMKTV